MGNNPFTALLELCSERSLDQAHRACIAHTMAACGIASIRDADLLFEREGLALKVHKLPQQACGEPVLI